MRILFVVVVMALVAAGCGSANQPAQNAPPAGPSPKAYTNLAKVMRGIPFPASNIIFDTQSNDPAAKPTEAGGSGGATAAFSGVYGGWEAVENAAMAISETANLIMIPGRLCQNGRPVPLDRADFQKFAQGLADAGQAALQGGAVQEPRRDGGGQRHGIRCVRGLPRGLSRQGKRQGPVHVDA